MTGFLASVTNVDEARIALEVGADIIDLKNPVLGALGALPIPVIEEIVHFVDGRRPVSATVGDLPMQPSVLCDAVETTAATGVDMVKIGFFGKERHAECAQILASVAQRGKKIIAVMFADQRPDITLLPLLSDAGFHGVMLDTANKSAGGLRDWLSESDLQNFVSTALTHGLLTGLAGSLQESDIFPLASLNADYLGFRGALCSDNERTFTLDLERIIAIRKVVAQMQQPILNGDREVAIPSCFAYSSFELSTTGV